MQFGFGSGLLYATRTDTAGPNTPVRFGALQDVTIGFDGEIKELFGQYQFPLAVARGKVKIEGKAKFAQIDAVEYNETFFGQTVTVGQELGAFNETHTIPATPFQVTVTNAADFVDDLGVFDALTGTQYTRVSATPSAGQYSVNTTTGVYTFNTADAGDSVYINYTYTESTTGNTITIDQKLMGVTPTFQAWFQQSFNNKMVTIKLLACVSNKLSFPTKLDDFVVQEFDFQAFANSGGHIGAITTAPV